MLVSGRVYHFYTTSTLLYFTSTGSCATAFSQNYKDSVEKWVMNILFCRKLLKYSSRFPFKLQSCLSVIFISHKIHGTCIFTHIYLYLHLRIDIYHKKVIKHQRVGMYRFTIYRATYRDPTAGICCRLKRGEKWGGSSMPNHFRCSALRYLHGDMDTLLAIPSEGYTVHACKELDRIGVIHAFSDASHAPYRFNGRRSITGAVIFVGALW